MKAGPAAVLLSMALALLPLDLSTRAQPAAPPPASIDIPPIWSKVGVNAAVASEMATAEAVCAPYPNETLYALVRCRDSADSTVWGDYEPSTMDLFQRFSDHRLQLAQQYDRQQITVDQLTAQLGVADLQLAYARSDRLNATQQAQAAQAAQQAQAAKQQADSGICSQQAQQAVDALQLQGCRGCTGINVLTIMETRQNTYANCMAARGWRVSQ